MESETRKKAGPDEVLVFISSPVSGKVMFFEGVSADVSADKMFNAMQSGELMGIFQLKDASNIAITKVTGYDEHDDKTHFTTVIQRLPTGAPERMASPVMWNAKRILQQLCFADIENTKKLDSLSRGEKNRDESWKIMVFAILIPSLILIAALIVLMSRGYFDDGAKIGASQTEAQKAPGRGK